jgi:hypothetical protein
MEIINFSKQIVARYFPSNKKFEVWGSDNLLPITLKNYYDSIPEHASCIDFIINSLTNKLGEDKNFLIKKRLIFDYYVYGGFAIEITKNRDNTVNHYYIPISKLRYSKDGTEVGYSDNWEENNSKIKWRTASDGKSAGIFIYKNTFDVDYPRATYIPSLVNLDTYKEVMDYHNNSAKNGFTPTVVFSFFDGKPDVATQKQYEKKIADKFTGGNGQKFILLFNNNKDSAPEIKTIETNNLDEKFDNLQKFIQNTIFVSHKITSPQLIGVKAESQGFSKTEFKESLEVFDEIVISPLYKEIEHGFKLINLI